MPLPLRQTATEGSLAGKRSNRKVLSQGLTAITKGLWLWITAMQIFTFHMRHSRGQMYIGTAVCVSVPRHIPTLLRDPDVTWWNSRECPPVVHYWVDLQSVHRFRCYNNIHVCKSYTLQMHIAPNTKCHGWFYNGYNGHDDDNDRDSSATKPDAVDWCWRSLQYSSHCHPAAAAAAAAVLSAKLCCIVDAGSPASHLITWDALQALAVMCSSTTLDARRLLSSSCTNNETNLVALWDERGQTKCCKKVKVLILLVKETPIILTIKSWPFLSAC